MTNLTEQWKKGELPDGWYWVKGARAEGIYAYTSEYLNNIYRPADGEKIVEKVPTYDEYLEMEGHCGAYSEINQWNKEEISAYRRRVEELKHSNENLRLALSTYELPEIQKILIDWRTGELDIKFNKLEAENTKLKELLKECQGSIATLLSKRITEVNGIKQKELLAEINQVLGDKTDDTKNI